MKKMRKILSLMLTMIMVFTMSANVFAAKITISGGAEGSVYVAYKVLNATDGGNGKYAYTLNEKYEAALKEVTGKDNQKEIIAYIEALKDNAAEVRTFADALYSKINNEKVDYTSESGIFSEVEQGYYLIAEKTLGSEQDTYSLVMLDTAGKDDITVKTKEDTPTVEKKVEEKNDSTGESSWGDSADYDVNDVINYKITGTVSSKYADYQNYYYSFGDTMDAGLTLNKDFIKVTINDTDVTSQFTIEAEDHAFTATANLKKLTGVTIDANTKIIVTYTATLNENAVSGTTGNKNKVVLEYENNPYNKEDGKPEKPGKTPEDVNIVFTYDVVVNKTDNENQPLAGAGFTLYKYDSVAKDWVAVGSEITGVTTFEFKKLDEGKYKLVETTVPAGYNKADDIEFEIASTLEGTELKGLTVTPNDDKFTITLESGKIETTVVNQSGAELPETGGIGTTIFYVVGAILVIGAAVVLITRRRMDA